MPLEPGGLESDWVDDDSTHPDDRTRPEGLQRLLGTTLSVNSGMLRLAHKLGFKSAADPESATVTNLTLDLAAAPYRTDR